MEGEKGWEWRRVYEGVRVEVAVACVAANRTTPTAIAATNPN